MLYVLIGISLLFGLIGFIVTTKNAKYILSGYNTLSEKEQQKIDIEPYLLFFKKFQIFLGVSLLSIGLLLYFFVSENAAGIFLSLYPIVAYIYCIWKSNSYYNGVSSKNSKVGIFVLTGVFIFVIALLGLGFKEDKLTVTKALIHIGGTYSEDIPKAEIDTIYLVNQTPKISYKSNGFALGSINKGYFKTKEGEEIKLILNSKNKPYIFILKKSGAKIYFSAKDRSNEEIYREIQLTLSNN